MRLPYEELDYRETPMGALMLRRRALPGGDDVFEVKLGDDFLMSSQHTAGEIALATFGLDACQHAAPDVVVGGLGLGYTAMAALAHEPRVGSLTVIETFAEVIDCHRRGLDPLPLVVPTPHRTPPRRVGGPSDTERQHPRLAVRQGDGPVARNGIPALARRAVAGSSAPPPVHRPRRAVTPLGAFASLPPGEPRLSHRSTGTT